MPDLKTSWLSLPLRNPLVASSSPLTENPDNIKRLEDAGAAAIVFHSLFEEQITLEETWLNHYLNRGEESFAEALTYFPDMHAYQFGPDEYLDEIERAKREVDIPIIGSLNGATSGGWLNYAKAIEEVGADALELNIYFMPTDPNVSGQEVEDRYVNLVRSVKKELRIPVAVKISPFFSSPANMARRLAEAGADGLVLFNRFYQPDFDLDTLDVVPNLVLSNSEELRLRLRWVAILYGHVKADLAITGGIHKATDVLKAMMAGANIAMMTSAVLKNGIKHFATVLSDLEKWMVEHEYESIHQMQGSMSQQAVAEPLAFERANYIRVLHSYAARPLRNL